VAETGAQVMVAGSLLKAAAASNAAGGYNYGNNSSGNNSNNNNNSGAGTRRKNRIGDKGQPNSTETNNSGTTTKKYGPDGNVQKEYNDGHGSNAPKNEQGPHVHDYKPNPHNPTGRGERQPGRVPKRNELKKDFGR